MENIKQVSEGSAFFWPLAVVYRLDEHQMGSCCCAVLVPSFDHCFLFLLELAFAGHRKSRLNWRGVGTGLFIERPGIRFCRQLPEVHYFECESRQIFLLWCQLQRQGVWRSFHHSLIALQTSSPCLRSMVFMF